MFRRASRSSNVCDRRSSNVPLIVINRKRDCYFHRRPFVCNWQIKIYDVIATARFSLPEKIRESWRTLALTRNYARLHAEVAEASTSLAGEWEVILKKRAIANRSCDRTLSRRGTNQKKQKWTKKYDSFQLLASEIFANYNNRPADLHFRKCGPAL